MQTPCPHQERPTFEGSRLHDGERAHGNHQGKGPPEQVYSLSPEGCNTHGLHRRGLQRHRSSTGGWTELAAEPRSWKAEVRTPPSARAQRAGRGGRGVTRNGGQVQVLPHFFCSWSAGRKQKQRIRRQTQRTSRTRISSTEEASVLSLEGHTKCQRDDAEKTPSIRTVMTFQNARLTGETRTGWQR